MSILDAATAATATTVLAPNGTTGRAGPDYLDQARASGHTPVRNGIASVASLTLPDDLSREVYCILGMPIDAIAMHDALHRVQSAVSAKAPFLISTANVNWLVNSESDSDFRESLVRSDLCTADGMPIVWIAGLLGIPIKSRISGCDIFDALKAQHSAAHPLKVFLFGGAEGVAAAASRTLNGQGGGINCVGVFYPGFCSAEEMSRDDIIDGINSSGADFLVASLGAQKGQAWLQRNHHRFSIPVRAHLGALINFQASTLRRAPLAMQRLGFEWLWRIKEEPYLWRRYWNDGRVLVRLLFTRVLPLAFWTWWLRVNCGRLGEKMIVTEEGGHEAVIVRFCGAANARCVDEAIRVFDRAITTKKQIILEFSDTRSIDARFLGLLLMLKKKLKGTGSGLLISGLSTRLRRMFCLSGLECMLLESGLRAHLDTVVIGSLSSPQALSEARPFADSRERA